MKTLSIFRNLSAFSLLHSDDSRQDDPHDFLSNLEDDEHAEMVDGYMAAEPNGSQRETMGFTLPEGFAGNHFLDIQGAGTLCFLTFLKRNLPARVIRDRVDEMCDEIEKTTGRRPGRKERKELSEDAELELLPKAFISKTRVPVIFTSDRQVFIFTTAQKRIDSCHVFLHRFFEGNDVAYAPVAFGIDYKMVVNAEAWMNSLALGSRDEDTFSATDFATMREGVNGKLRVTNRDIAHQEVQNALKSGWRIAQMGLLCHANNTQFRMDEMMRLRQIELADDIQIESAESEDELVAVTWLVIREYRTLLDAIREATEDEAL